MTKLLLLVAFITCAPAFADTKLGFSDESEAGIVITSGNARSQSYSFRQLNHYRWEHDVLRFDGKFLRTSTSGLEAAKNWLLGLRYERSLVNDLSAYAGWSVEGNRFAGFLQRHSYDVGAKYYLVKEELLYVFAEGGYRRSIENRVEGGEVPQSLLRLYTEGNRDWTKTFSTKLGLEYLPNLTISSDYQLNLELSASAAINEIFALKTGYALKYRKIPVAPATQSTDTTFTTAIVAKF